MWPRKGKVASCWRHSGFGSFITVIQPHTNPTVTQLCSCLLFRIGRRQGFRERVRRSILSMSLRFVEGVHGLHFL